VNLPYPFNEEISLLEITQVLRSSANSYAWDSWGVRDAAVLTNSDGSFLDFSNQIHIYYTGSSNKGVIQKTGLAISRDNLNFKKCSDNPILSTKKHTYRSTVAAGPWVIFYKDKFFAYFRTSSNPCVTDSISVATGDNPYNLKILDHNPILTSSDFSGIRTSPSELGVLNAVSDYNNDIIILFEANEKNNSQKGQIFAAKSSDGYNFSPLKDGQPFFSASDVTGWPVVAVCNPRLTQIGNGWYMLAFNGTSGNGEYSIGLACTKDFTNWYEHPCNPILIPTSSPQISANLKRLEGACFDTDSLTNKKSSVSCYFMAIPFSVPNHKNATICKANFNIQPNHFIPDKSQNIGLIKSFTKNSSRCINSFLTPYSSVELDSDSTSHMLLDPYHSYSLTISPKESQRNSYLLLSLSKSFTSFFDIQSVVFAVYRNKLYKLEPVYQLGGTLSDKVDNRLYSIKLFLEKALFPQHPPFFLKKKSTFIKNIPDNNHIKLSLTSSQGLNSLFFGDSCISTIPFRDHKLILSLLAVDASISYKLNSIHV
jgi:predicted GH43/DUF377 family glycosyl hydrolase